MPVATEGVGEDDEFRRDDLALVVADAATPVTSPAAAAAATLELLLRLRNDMALASFMIVADGCRLRVTYVLRVRKIRTYVYDHSFLYGFRACRAVNLNVH